MGDDAKLLLMLINNGKNNLMDTTISFSSNTQCNRHTQCITTTVIVEEEISYTQ